MKRDHLRVSFLSDAREPHLSRAHSPEEEEDEGTETEGIDVDDAEGGDFNEDAEEEYIGGFWGGINDLDSVASVGREATGEDHEMWADLASVQNSTECEAEAVPIIQDSEPSINDSVSPLTSFGSKHHDILTMFNRTIKHLKAAVEMKPASTMQVKELRWITCKWQQLRTKSPRNRGGRREKGFRTDSQMH